MTCTTPLEMSAAYDSLMLSGYAEDTMDLDTDCNFDIFFNLSIHNTDSLHLLTSMPSTFPL